MPHSHSDVIIIGGGAIGICSAYYLCNQGYQVTVLEKGEIGGGCSFGNAGWICPSHVIPLAAPKVVEKGIRWMFDPESPFYIKPRADPELARWLWTFRNHCNYTHLKKSVPVFYELSVASLGLFKAFARELGNSFYFEQRGLVVAAMTDGGIKGCHDEARWARQAGLHVDDLSASEVCALEPTVRQEVKGGAFFHIDSHLDPAAFVTTLADDLRKRGVAIHTHAEVTGFDLDSNSRRVKAIWTKSGDFSADEIVIASGAWSPLIARELGIHIPIQPAKGYSVTLPQSQSHTSRLVMLYEAKVAVTPLGDRIRYAGTLELAGMDLSINQRRVNAILRAADKYLTNFSAEQARQAKPWAGWRPCSPDGLPYLGRSKACGNVTVATGHAMLGISLAPITGQLVSEVVANEKPSIDLAMMRVDRFG